MCNTSYSEKERLIVWAATLRQRIWNLSSPFRSVLLTNTAERRKPLDCTKRVSAHTYLGFISVTLSYDRGRRLPLQPDTQGYVVVLIGKESLQDPLNMLIAQISKRPPHLPPVMANCQRPNFRCKRVCGRELYVARGCAIED